MKNAICYGLTALCAAAAVVFAMLYRTETSRRETVQVFFSADGQWLLSGRQRIFDVTERTFDLKSLFGYAEGIDKWPPIGGRKSAYSPHFIPIAKTATMTDGEYVIGVSNGSTATAYPLKILADHQVVNDSTQDPPVLIYYGDTSRTATAYLAAAGENRPSFACTGYLYKNVDILFDSVTGSLFMPLTGVFASGPLIGERLPGAPCAVVTIGQWKTLFPESRLMTENTGVPNTKYPRREVLFRKVSLKTRSSGSTQTPRSEAETPVIAVCEGWQSAAVSFSLAKEAGQRTVRIPLGDKSLRAHFDEGFRSAYVTDEEDRLAHSLRSLRQVYESLVPEGDLPKTVASPQAPGK